MAEGTTQGILLMADISGYSEFVHRHTRSAGHARQITVRLLKAIVSASSPPLSVAELEFDGRDLIRMGLRPGPDFGLILDDLLDFVLEDPARNRTEMLESRVGDIAGSGDG